MKKYIILLVFAFCLQSLHAQSTSYDIEMEKLAEKTAQRVKEQKKLNVAVWFFHDSKGKKTELGDYVGLDFSVHFTNVSREFNVIDRNHIEQLSKEHEWAEQGFISQETVKNIGHITGADAIVTGTVDPALHKLRFRIKIIDTETGKYLSAVIGNIPPDENIKYILRDYFKEHDVNIDKDKKRASNEEVYKNPKTTNVKCEELNVGDYCFANRAEKDYLIDITSLSGTRFRKTIVVDAGRDVCVYDLPVGTYQYKMYGNKLRTTSGAQLSGRFRIEKCKSITYEIKPSQAKPHNPVDDFYRMIKKND